MVYALLIGGGSFVGTNLADKLQTIGYNVGIIDLRIQTSSISSNKKIEYFEGDATNLAFLIEKIDKCQPDIVFIIASVGMSGQEMLHKKCIEINSLFVSEAIKACIHCNVSKLLYTSTYNVVFGGQEIVNGNEKISAFPIAKHTDFYSASKCIAENIVLEANNSKLSNGKGTLTTTSLRPAAIYGEGEQRHFPRLIHHIDSGLFLFRIGNAIVDWIHIDNLTEAYVCGAKKLLSPNHTDIGGQSYFISDGSPISNFEFLRPLCEARGCPYPSIVLPTQLIAYFAYVMEMLYFLFKIKPFLIRAEVYKVGITHYFSIEKAKNELGYKPLFNSQQGMVRVAKYYSQPSAMSSLYVSSFDLLHTIPVWCQPFHAFYSTLEIVNLAIWPSRYSLYIIFWLGNLAHFIEAIYCYNLALKMGCINTKWLWTLQTLFLGYFSIMMLTKRQPFIDNINSKNN